MTEPTQQRPFPRHIAIIMDGNGRWAKARGLPRLEGHRRGVEKVRQVLKDADELGLKHVTLYSFSTENWARPETEVTGLMQLFRLFFNRYLKEMHKNNVRIRFIGQRERLDEDIIHLIEKAVTTTKDNTGLNAIFAFNYGGRAEIVDAAQSLLEEVRAGTLTVDDIDQEKLEARLSTNGIPDPEVILRTSGEERISNYLMWQSVDSEFQMIDTLWPDFAKDDLEMAINLYRHHS